MIFHVSCVLHAREREYCHDWLAIYRTVLANGFGYTVDMTHGSDDPHDHK